MKKIDYSKTERIVKAFASRRRLQILELLEAQPELSVFEISEAIKSEAKNVSAHIGKMAVGGLLMKRYEGNNVRHKLTQRGKSILQFVRIVE
jgi:DNA-binding transcriptional ArsR family regulator